MRNVEYLASSLPSTEQNHPTLVSSSRQTYPYKHESQTFRDSLSTISAAEFRPLATFKEVNLLRGNAELLGLKTRPETQFQKEQLTKCNLISSENWEHCWRRKCRKKLHITSPSVANILRFHHPHYPIRIPRSCQSRRNSHGALESRTLA